MTKRLSPPFTPEQLIQIEFEINRAVGAISRYADEDTMASLRAAEYIMAEIRNAGLSVSDPEADVISKVSWGSRLLEMFTNSFSK